MKKARMEVICLKSKFLRNIFDQNTYVIKSGNSAIIVDAGAEIEDVKNALTGLKVKAILMTHLHFDHFWNLENYLHEFDCDVYVCAKISNFVTRHACKHVLKLKR